jgi:2-methylaconitate cis-trans-isomerase PrpF
MVAEPKTYLTMRGHSVEPQAIDLRARMVWYNRCHESMAGTGSMCTAAASRIPDSIVNRTIGPVAAQADTLRIGHPMGVMKVNVSARPANVPGGVHFEAYHGWIRVCAARRPCRR